MERGGNASPLSIPSPQSPAAPLALSEFMAQTAPCSDTSHPSVKTPLSPDISRPRDAEDTRSGLSPLDAPQTQMPPRSQEPQTARMPPPTPQGTPPPTDWLATRQQLLPRRNQGNKADWIRGWSEAVTIHGAETYCACSETVETTRGRKGKANDLAGNVRAILQRTASPSNNKPATPSEPEVCRHCSRPASPPPSTATSLSSEKQASHSSRGFGKRVSDLLMRVRPLRQGQPSSKSAHKRDVEIRQVAWPEEYQPRWATTGQGHKRLLVRPPSQPLPAATLTPVQKSQSMDIFPGHARARINTGTTSSDTSDSDARRGGLSRSMSRLQRAAAMLHRATTRPKD